MPIHTIRHPRHTCRVTLYYDHDRAYLTLLSEDDHALLTWWDGAVDEAFEDGWLPCSAVCMGQIMDHGRLRDACYRIWVQSGCPDGGNIHPADDDDRVD